MTDADRTVAVELIARSSAYTRETNLAAGATERLAVSFQQAAKSQRAFEGSQARVTAATTKAAQAARAAEAAQKKQLASMTALGKGFLAVGAVAGVGLGAAVKASIDFGREMANVRALARTSGQDFQALTNAALNVGTQFGFTATQVAQGEAELVKAGISVRDILGGGLVGALTLASAGQTDLATATTIAASAMTQFGLSGKDVPHIADLLAAGADKALGSVTDLGFALQQVGTPAAQAGISIENTVGALAALAQNAQIGERGGTTLKQVLLQLQAPSKQAATLMERYGISLYDANGNTKDFTALAGNLHTSLSGLSAAQRDNALATIFGSHAIQGARVLYQQGAAGIAAWTTTVNDSGFAAGQASDKLDSLAGDLQKLHASFQTALIQTGDQASSSLRGVVEHVTSLVEAYNHLSPAGKQTVVSLAAITAAAGLTGGAFLILTPRVAATVAAFKALQASSPGTVAALRAVGAAALVISTAEVSKSLEGYIATSNVADVKTKDLADALQDLGERGKFGKAGLDLFSHGLLGQANSTNEALKKFGISAYNALDQGFDAKIRRLTDSGAVPKFQKQVGELDQGLAELVSSGHTDDAVSAFNRLTAAAIKEGVPLSSVTRRFPLYAAALKEAQTGTSALERESGKASLALVDAGQNADATASAMLILGKNADASSSAVKNLATAISKDMAAASKGFEGGTDVLGSFTGGNLGKSFSKSVTLARQFTRDIAEATRRGLDPNLISQLLQEGPERAAPALRQLVSSHGAGLIKLANSSARALSRIEQQAVEQARLTSIAVNSATDQAANDLGAAMRISQAKARQGAKATVQSIAAELGIGVSRARRIAHEFGIGLDEGVESGTKPAKRKIDDLSDSMKNIPKHTMATVDITVSGEAALIRANALIQAAQYASGNAYSTSGSVPKPKLPKGTRRDWQGGTISRFSTGGSVSGDVPGRDTVPALLDIGEEVINKRSARKWRPVLKMINADRMAAGGTAGQPNLSDIFSMIQTSGGTKAKPLTAFATQFAQATIKTTRTDAAFIANLQRLASKGFGFLAMQLLEQGDHTAKVIAAQALGWSTKRLSAEQTALQRSASQQKQLGLLPAELAITGALKSGRNPTLASIAAASGLDIADLQAGLQAMQKQLSGNKNAAQLLRGLNTVGSYQQTSFGSTTAGAGPAFTVQVVDKSGDPIRAGEKAGAGVQRVMSVSGGKW